MYRDIIPDPSNIQVGSQVLFVQGEYDGPEGLASRWHCGRISKIENGKYFGRHVYGEINGKWIGFDGYSETFENYTVEQLRLYSGRLAASENSQIDSSNEIILEKGARVKALWRQHYSAEIVKYFPENQTYQLAWDDGDTHGTRVPIYKVTVRRHTAQDILEIVDSNHPSIDGISIYKPGTKVDAYYFPGPGNYYLAKIDTGWFGGFLNL